MKKRYQSHTCIQSDPMRKGRACKTNKAFAIVNLPLQYYVKYSVMTRVDVSARI